MGAPVVIVGTAVNDSVTDVALHKYNHVGGVYPHGHRTSVPGSLDAITGVALDASGQQYGCGSAGTAGYTTFCMSPDGDVRWTAHHQAPVWGLAMDEDHGQLYTVGAAVNASGTLYPDSVWEGGGVTGNRTGYVTTRAYNLATGTLVWSADHGFSYRASRMSITYAHGRVYTSGEGREIGDGGDAGGNLTCYDATTGAVIWSAGKTTMATGYGFLPYALVADVNDCLYVAGIFTLSDQHYGLLKYDATGALVSSALVITNISGGRLPGLGVVLTSTGAVIVATMPVLYDSVYEYYKTLHQYTSELAWVGSNAGHFDRLIAVGGLAIDSDDRLYLAAGHWRGIAQRTQDTLTMVGLEVFTTNVDNNWTWALTQTDLISNPVDAYSVAVRVVETPPLRLPLALAMPTWQGDLYSLIPGLPLPLALAVPYLLREYVGLSQPDIYRLFLTGTPDLELPLASLSHRATATGLRFDVVSPGSTSATLAAVEARASGDLVLYRGVRLSTGEEQLEELARAALESVRSDVGGNSASLSLSGSAASTAPHVKKRVLRGISYRAETGGVRRVRGAVDPHLRVGDTADLGSGETLIVSSITIYVSAASAVMEIAE